MLKYIFSKYYNIIIMCLLVIIIIPLMTLPTLAQDNNNDNNDNNLPPVANPSLDPKKHPIANSAMVLEPVYFKGEDSYDPNVEDNLTYYWDFGDGDTSEQISPAHIYHRIGEYRVILTVNDSHVSDTRTMIIIVISERNHNPVAKILHDTIKDDKGNYYANVSEPIHFDGSGSFDPDGSPLTFKWDFGDGTTSYQQIITHEYIKDGIYTVVLTVTDDESLVREESISIIIGTGRPSGNGGSDNSKEEITNLGLLIVGVVAIIIILLVVIWLFLLRLRKRVALKSAIGTSDEKKVYSGKSVSTGRAKQELPLPEFAKPDIKARERVTRSTREKQLSMNEAKLKQTMLRKKLQEERKKLDDDMKKELENLGVEL